MLSFGIRWFFSSWYFQCEIVDELALGLTEEVGKRSEKQQVLWRGVVRGKGIDR